MEQWEGLWHWSSVKYGLRAGVRKQWYQLALCHESLTETWHLHRAGEKAVIPVSTVSREFDRDRTGEKAVIPVSTVSRDLTLTQDRWKKKWYQLALCHESLTVTWHLHRRGEKAVIPVSTVSRKFDRNLTLTQERWESSENSLYCVRRV